MNTKLFFIITLSLIVNLGYAQTNEHPFWADVQTIKAYDKLFTPPAHPVLFAGSSSIRRWNNLQWTFASYDALNRGVGGMVINDLIYFVDDVILRYQPKQIVLYIGENDIPRQDETADTIFNRTVRLYKAIRSKMPMVPIAYISIKPSPSRAKYQQKAVDANKLIKIYLAEQANTSYINVYPLMLNAKGQMRPELFVNDMLHMNAAGYAIWEKAVKPYLLK